MSEEKTEVTNDMVNDAYEVLVTFLCRLDDQDLAARGLEKANRVLGDLFYSPETKLEKVCEMIAKTQKWVEEDVKALAAKQKLAAKKAEELEKHEAVYVQYQANSQVTYFDMALEFYAQWVRDEKSLGHEDGQKIVDQQFHKVFVGLSARVLALVIEDVESLTADVLQTIEDMKKFRALEILHVISEDMSGWLRSRYAEMFKLTEAFAQSKTWFDEDQDMDWVNRGWRLHDGVLSAPWGYCPGEIHAGNKVKLFPIGKRGGGFFLPRENHVCSDCAHARGNSSDGSSDGGSKMNAQAELNLGAADNPDAFEGISFNGQAVVLSAETFVATPEKPSKGRKGKGRKEVKADENSEKPKARKQTRAQRQLHEAE